MGLRAEGAERARQPTGKLRSALLGAVFLASLLPTTPAQADFHLIKIREVFAGGAANSSYVVLQMYEPAQGNLAPSHHIDLYGPGGGSPVTTFTFSNDVSNAQDQATVLVADTGYAAAFPSGPAPDATHAALDIPTGGGAVCFDAPDCVSWGNFSGNFPQADPPVSPSGITAGMAIRRTITGGSCTNQLDAGDDTNDSAADFGEQTPHPRSNSSPIEEGATCIPPATPDTTITSASVPASPGRTKSTEASFSFAASPADAETTFECSLDSGAFAACTSPKGYTGLTGGAGTSHTFRVRAVHPSNGTDGTPASHTWIVDTVAPTATILTQPEDPSPGNSASFTYSSNETGSSFQCSLEPSGELASFSACPSTGKTYPDAEHPAPLADGKWTFEVLATDKAGNAGAADAFTWKVDNSLADKTPPQTTIESAPPDPSTSATASFTYSSSEAGSSFECALDSAGFASCPASGIVYSTLANGSHSFQVRARDGVGNVDETPAGYSWQIALSATIAPPVLPQAPRPQTTITAKPGAVTRDRTPSFRFRSSVAGSRFQCKVDRGGFKACRSPFTTKPLSPGRHVVAIRAAAGGLVDPTPAKAKFKLLKR